ncbi:MAG: alanine--glyoxylate aminotransferase family protein [SAR202 cluster bacterium]|nr:alanine--glyoxylate aminotransferase family protein [SAR202 cluster bacterium]
MERHMTELAPPARLLLGAGPANPHPRVLRAMTASLLGHLDPDFLQIMDDVRAMLRLTFKTSNTITLPVSGTGTAGMEASLVNVLEAGDTLVVAANGYFCQRLVDIGSRIGANVVTVTHSYGQVVDVGRVRDELRRLPRVKALAMVHAETSTGVLSPVREMAEVAHEAGALLIVDAVTSLGGSELRIDDWGVDICYSATQKCLACPPGLSPITMSDRAVEAMEGRQSPVVSFYFDLTKLRQYWHERAYHHTAPISMIYALREGLRILLEEGLEQSWRRHELHGAALRAGVQALGLSLLAPEGHRLPSLTAIRVPDGISDAPVKRHLLTKHNVEISAGLGEQAGKLWRVGLMGYNSSPSTVFTFLSAFEDALQANDYEVAVGASVAAAQRVYAGRATAD